MVVFVNGPPLAERRIDFDVFFTVLCCLMVGKYALICAMEIQKFIWLFISSQDLLSVSSS